mmetsp:Transcript_30974/g.68639  ORF Transcript_30974/g.68639 Transcript_30974/m.68639 type:complete len:1037 (+) Transcript_30974:146-3256(+)|eukprot:CAMPEP_0202903442 /NCGR_PEP_ID=MMETSP1392-20130828/24442_1 /ASSEMBLY_ACC=CAM_ASM_000868 /TAXON_ID=225041 /ORGANISM="Chlamydomonas chlamydogama, Strain SAG 11-48b" /LENGTH=1036 /DNA_ID=CAMNT_0049590621 /DNA_START=90 /DNA_END=3200 /DNA_ORIENTATION=-
MYAQQQMSAGRCHAIVPGASTRFTILPGRGRVVRKIVCAAAPVESPSMPTPRFEPDEPSTKAFPYPLPMDGAQKTLSGIPLPLFYPALAAFVGAAGFAGSLFGRALPVDPEAKDVSSYGVAAVVGAGAVAACVQAKKKRDSVAVVELYNTLVDLDDPSNLTPQMVSDVGSKYGLNMQRDEVDGLRKIYGQFLESVIPSGETQLRGDEADRVRALKDALGLSDEDAAPAHIDVARRLYRQGFETKDRQQQFEQRKAFQRLVYVSQLVYGDQKAAFLLPWRRHFNLTEAQLFVARRDNAKAIFRARFEAKGGDLLAERHFLRELRDEQLAIKMMDESAEEVVREAARKHVEGQLTKAMEAIRATGKNKDLATMMASVSHVLDYSRRLDKYAQEEDLIPGLGHVSITGGPLAEPTKAREVKDVYKAYLEEQLNRDNEFSSSLEADARDLQTILGLAAREAQVLQDEVAAKLYKKLLREEVTSRRIDEAESPASVLQQLCDRVKFSPEAALDLHRQLYKQKLAQLIDKGRLSEQDQADLARIRRVLCLPEAVVKKVSRETSGKVLEEALSDIFMMGAKPVSESDLASIAKLAEDLAIDPDVAMEVMTAVTRERFRSFVQAAQKERNDRKAFAASIKKMVQFNALVVTPLLERIKGMDKAKKELADLMMKAMEEAKKEGATPEMQAAAAEKAKEEQLKQVQKAIQANRGEFGEEERKGQKEVTLKDDLEPKTRADIYKNYLMYTMAGDVVELPVGGMIRKKNNNMARQAEMARLSQLGELLGMNQMEVAAAHQDLAEEAYKSQATEVMRSGPMSEEKAQYLEDMRTQLGISKEAGDKVLKNVRSEIYGTSAALEDGGRWTLDKIMDVTSQGGSIEGLVEEVTRRNIFRKELERRVTDGSGDLDADFVLKKLPEVLVLEQRKVAMVIKEIVSSRKRMLLVQAVSQQRQKRTNEVVTSLQNLLSCTRALPEAGPMSWTDREELKDLYALFCDKEDSAAKQTELAAVLGLSEEDAVSIRTGAASEGAESGKRSSSARDEEDEFF